ncbi:MAG: UDP-2,3-diacylglucosamine diphosphatase LpxI [Xanthobacteraceae bacterium]
MTAPVSGTMAGSPPLAIICGGGSLPGAVATQVSKSGRRVVLFAVRGWADPAVVSAFPHHWVDLGRYGMFRRLAQAESCRDVVFIGTILRPSLRQIRFDWSTLRALPRIVQAFKGGDDHMLSSFSRILAEDGFRIVGAHEVAPDILVGEGQLGRCAPSAREQADIAYALDLLHAISPFDVGQACVVADRHVLAIEAAEGTDGVLDRIVALRNAGRIRTPHGTGVLVKAPKARQSRRFDLPTIGPQTVAGVARAGLAGLAVVAGATIIAEPQKVIADANAAAIFVVGVPVPAAS